jgi:hypothetical protein
MIEVNSFTANKKARPEVYLMDSVDRVGGGPRAVIDRFLHLLRGRDPTRFNQNAMYSPFTWESNVKSF